MQITPGSNPCGAPLSPHSLQTPQQFPLTPPRHTCLSRFLLLIPLPLLVYAGESSPQFQIWTLLVREGELFLSMWPTRARPLTPSVPSGPGQVGLDAPPHLLTISHHYAPPCLSDAWPQFPCAAPWVQPASPVPIQHGYRDLQSCAYKRRTQILVLAGMPFPHLYILALENMLQEGGCEWTLKIITSRPTRTAVRAGVASKRTEPAAWSMYGSQLCPRH